MIKHRLYRIPSARRILARKSSVRDWCEGRYESRVVRTDPICLRRRRYDSQLHAWVLVDEPATPHPCSTSIQPRRVIRDGISFEYIPVSA